MIKNLIRRLRVIAIRTTVGGQELPSPRVAIVLAPHPDDEVLGCCGLMQRLIGEGRRVELVLMTGGGKSHAGCCDVDAQELVRQRRLLTLRAAAVYGLPECHIHFLDYQDGSIAAGHPETQKLDALLRRLTAGEKDVAVFYPHLAGEGWPDHVATGRIAARLCRDICPGARQYEYCVWFWFYNCWKIDRRNAYRVTMSPREHATKLRAIREYVEPKAPCGKPWSGVLPPVFVWANKWNRELYFKVK